LIHENLIRIALSDLNLSNDIFSVICGLSPTRLSRAFRGLQDFTGPEIEMLSKIIEDLRGIIVDCKPIPVNFGNPQIIKELLRKRRAGIRYISTLVGVEE
jgi:hypothetical protein